MMPVSKPRLAAAAGLGASLLLLRRGDRHKPHYVTTSWRSKISSHDSFTHDSIDSLGYDWERIANPSIAPKHPLKVYLPQTTEELVRIVRDSNTLGDRLVVRSKGHSSNNLVLVDRGSIVVTEKLNSIIEFREADRVVKVQAGTVSAELDDYLAQHGYGLPVIGDHAHITVGGFASVGGISPASHRFGMFVDNVVELEYVDWEGEMHTCSRTSEPERFYRVLAGLGREGIMATLTLKVIPIDKYGMIWRNERSLYKDVDRFIEGSSRYISDPGDVMMERGLWCDFPGRGGKGIGFGQFSAYKETPQGMYKRLRNKVEYGYLHGQGYFAGRLPQRIDRYLKYLSFGGVVLSPRYASIKNIEMFTDKMLDSSVGDPTRMLIVLGPIDRYEKLFRTLFDLFLEYRREHQCFTFISVYVKCITSDYLANGRDAKSFCELMFYFGINPEYMTDPLFDSLVDRFDRVAEQEGAFRYMHSKTVTDPERLRVLDPNAQYRPAEAGGQNGSGQLTEPLPASPRA